MSTCRVILYGSLLALAAHDPPGIARRATVRAHPRPASAGNEL